MGTGTYARQLKQYYPKMNITGVEIDQKITDLAGEYFDEPADIPVTTYDGRAWLAASHDKYDVIMVDAYQDITIPFQMSSTEFFTMVREHLNPGGVMVVNMNMISDGQGSINEALSDTIASVFGNGNTLTDDVPNTTNRELFAKKPGSGSEENSMQQASKALNLRETTYERTGSEDLEWYMEEVASRFRKVNEPDSASTILTDDKAPVEVLGMHASIKSSPMRPAHIGRFSKTKASAVCCAPCSRFDTRTANVRAYGRLSIWLEKSRKRGNPTWKPFKASGSRQTA